jgi:RHS repeat-associated protein
VESSVTPFGGAPSVTRYIVDARGKLSHVVAEVNAGGAIQAHYIRAGDELLSVVRPTGTRFYHADALGSVRRLTDETGAVTDTYTFDALGNLTAHAGSDPNPYLFAGEPIGAKGALYYNRARYLDPATGRFLSMDPLAGDAEQPKTLHRYLYALGNPVNFTDPSGEMGLASVSVSISFQSNLRSSNATASLSVLHRVKFLLGQTGRFTFRQLQSMRAANPSAFRNLQNHHLIEKRFWRHMPDLQKIFRTTDDIPSAFLSKADHQLITNAWQQVLGRVGTGTHIPYANLTLTEIRAAVNVVYANWPALKNALLLALI